MPARRASHWWARFGLTTVRAQTVVKARLVDGDYTQVLYGTPERAEKRTPVVRRGKKGGVLIGFLL
jgi:hypothetical protein